MIDKINESNVRKIVKYAAVALAALLVLIIWPFYSVPTGSRGVVTTFGAITGIEGEGLAMLPPWRKLTIFNIRAEQADVENAEGSTNDQQPVHVSLTVRYSIATDRVSEVFEKYSHNGDLSSYVQTATQEIFKAVTARYSAPDLISQRALVSRDTNAALTEKRLRQAVLSGIDRSAVREFEGHGTDVIFEAAQFYGWRLRIPAIAWVPDFQHRYLRGLFGFRSYWRRELGFRAQVWSRRHIMLSSEDARRDCENFYPATRGRTHVVRFAIEASDVSPAQSRAIADQYHMPDTFFFLPTMFKLGSQ